MPIIHVDAMCKGIVLPGWAAMLEDEVRHIIPLNCILISMERPPCKKSARMSRPSRVRRC